jgi:hypothetical protein
MGLASGRERVKNPPRMKLLFPLLGHLLVTLARLGSRGGVRSVVAESAAHNEAFAAKGPQSDFVGSADAWIVDAFGVIEARA